MPFYYFALGTSLAGLANLETTLANEPPPHVLEGGRIPLLGPIARRTLGQTVQRNGSIDVPIRFDVLRWSSLNTLITTYFGNYTTASAALFASWLSEDGYYYPYSVTLERPYEGEHYRLVDSVNAREIAIPGYDWTLQTNQVNTTGAVTASQRLVHSNTGAGSVTLTLPALSGVTANTIYSYIKDHASNNLVLDGNGAETINGNATLTMTALNARSDLIKTGATTWATV